jgi:uncharacterized repeat protein (TIGR01451 family)
MKDETQLVKRTFARTCARSGFLGIATAMALTLILGGKVQANPITGISIWNNFVTPQTPFFSTPAVTVGTKFRADVEGSVLALRFFKGAGNTGTHTGLLYDSAGTLLVQADFTNESASGWQQVDLPTPIQIHANQTYIVAYFSKGGFAVSQGTFTGTGVDSPPLHALQDGADGPNGVYYYDYHPHLPIFSGGGNSFFADVVFVGPAVPDLTISKTHSGNFVRGGTDHYTLTVSNVGVSPTNAPVTVSDTIPTGMSPISANGPGWVCQIVSQTVTCTRSDILASGSSYPPIDIEVSIAVSAPDSVVNTATVSGGGEVNLNNDSASDPTNIVNGPKSVSIFGALSGPQVPYLSAPDGTWGVKFRSDVAGSITDLRFYKGPGNTGTHIGLLYDSSGALLAKAQFVNETKFGWQDVVLSSPVPISANQTYIVAYWSETGLALTDGEFNASGVNNPPLHALKNGVAGFNGVYKYGFQPAFPTSDGGGANFWADVVFVP